MPFLTGSARDFAFSAINQNFVVPGSCPSLGLLSPPLVIFDVLKVDTDAKDITSNEDSTISFSAFAAPSSQSHYKRDGKPSYSSASDYEKLFVTYINQQNKPVSEKIEHVQIKDGVATFDALFPGKTFEMNGLTIAAVTVGDGPFADPDAVANATVFGPGLIEVN